MADNDRQNLREAIDGRIEYNDRLEELQAGARTEVDNIVFFLRRIPADDATKKQELRKYFETAEGSRYTREERHKAYNDLLGVERNKESRG